MRKARCSSTVWIALAVLVATAQALADTPIYAAYILSSPDYYQACATGIAGSQTAGYGNADFDNAVHALLWSGLSSAPLDLHPTGYVESWVRGASGTLQVGYADVLGPTEWRHAMVWAGSAASAVDLNPSGFEESLGLATSGTQQVGYGYFTQNSMVQCHALLWSGTPDSVVDLHPPGSQWLWSVASGVSDNTQTGTGTVYQDGSNHTRALLWSGTAASVVNLHSDTGPYMDTYGYATSGSQQVGAGYPADGSSHALLWSGSAESVVDLHPAGYSNSEALGVANSQQVGDADYLAMVWSGSAESAVNLHQFLPDSFTGGSLYPQESQAFAVDPNGNIVGQAEGSTGQYAVIWVPGSFKTKVSAQDSVKGAIGQTVTLSGTLTCGAVPLGFQALEFDIDGLMVDTSVTGSDGTASLAYKVPYWLGTGSHTLTVQYAGWGGFQASSTTATLTAGKGNTAFSLYAASGLPGANTTLRTMFLCGGQPVVGRTVSFAVDGTSVGTTTSTSSGASFPWTIPSPFAPGLHSVTVSFAGDSIYNASTRTTAALTVKKANVAFSLFAAKAAPGQTVTLKSLMLSSGQPVVGETVQFSVDDTVVGTGQSDVTGVSCSYTIPADMAPGAHNVTVAFGGDTKYNSATRTTAALTVVVIKGGTSISLYSVSGSAGQAVNLRCLLYGGGLPLSGKTVSFSVQGTPVSSASTNAAGVATVPYTIPISTVAGSYSVTAAFGGDAWYNATTRTTIALTVK